MQVIFRHAIEDITRARGSSDNTSLNRSDYHAMVIVNEMRCSHSPFVIPPGLADILKARAGPGCVICLQSGLNTKRSSAQNVTNVHQFYTTVIENAIRGPQSPLATPPGWLECPV
jgi:hypothetical protein